MAQLLDVEKGDTIKWHIAGSDKWVTTKIASVHADPISQRFSYDSNYFGGFGLNYTPTSIVTHENVTRNMMVLMR